MKVWIAYSGEWESRRADGIFTTRGAAIRCWAMHICRWDTPLFIALQNGWEDVEEFELDECPEQAPTM